MAWIGNNSLPVISCEARFLRSEWNFGARNLS